MDSFTGFNAVEPFRVTGTYDFRSIDETMYYSDAGYCFNLNGDNTCLAVALEDKLNQTLNQASKAVKYYEHLINPGESVLCSKKTTKTRRRRKP